MIAFPNESTVAQFGANAFFKLAEADRIRMVRVKPDGPQCGEPLRHKGVRNARFWTSRRQLSRASFIDWRESIVLAVIVVGSGSVAGRAAQNDAR